MYDVLVGKQRSLVFPVMCNAYVKIDYGSNVATTDYGIWDHEGSFTFEAIVTPYDVNGYCRLSTGGSLPVIRDSKKIMPGYDSTIAGNYQSNKYLNIGNRLVHKMCLFYSTSLKIYLVNSTLHNENKPAEYKIQVEMTIGGTTETFTSDAVITSNLDQQFDYSGSDLSGFNKLGKLQYEKITQVNGNFTAPVSSFDVDSASRLHANAQTVYIRDGFNFVPVGTISGLSGLTVSLNSPYLQDLSDNTDLFLEAYREPSYINSFYHVAVSYSKNLNTITLYLNGLQVFQDTHSNSGTFAFDQEDFYIGANDTGSRGDNSALANEQFMGELHELSISNVRKDSFQGYSNLMPNLNNALLYLRFEEVDN